MKTRMKPEARKEDILAAAVPLAIAAGYKSLTRDQVAAAAKISGPTLHYHFGTMEKFRKEMMRYAVKSGVLQIIAQGIVANDPQALKLSDVERKAALASF